MQISELWWSENEKLWKSALDKYWQYVMDNNLALEEKMEHLDPNRVEAMSVQEFYDFLHNEYYVWKYTAKNRLATTRKQLERYCSENRLSELADIKDALFSFDQDVEIVGLDIALRILGLGTAGASGLLAVLFPAYFATVDQFVVKSLRNIDGIPEKEMLDRMNPDSLKISDGVLLIKIMKRKAAELNYRFNTDYWTPRKIDKVLWSMR